MPLFGSKDNAANSDIAATSQVNLSTSTTNRTALYGNTTVGAFVPNKAVGQFGVDATEKANTASDLSLAQHSGWNLRTVGTGPINTIAVTAGGTGYSNTNLVAVTAPVGTGTVNASATISTNATGGIVSVTLTTKGAGFTAKNPTATITDATGNSAAVVGTGATLLVTAGGRAGRVSYETLVASGTISN